MRELQIVDKRIANILSSGFRYRVTATLGAMINIDSSAFYTASDVSWTILSRAGINQDTLSSSDRREFFESVSGVLSDAYTRKTNDVQRTTKRIRPRYAVDCKAAYGYRIGYARGTGMNADTIPEHKSLADSVPRTVDTSMPSALAIAEKAAGFLSYTELAQLELTIQALKHQMYTKLLKKDS